MGPLDFLARGVRTLGMLLLASTLGLVITIVHILIAPFTYFVDPHCNIHNMLNIWMTQVSTLPFVRVRIEGEEHIADGQTYCVVANHTSTLDAFVMSLLGHRVNFRSIIKHTLFYYPIFGALFYYGGFVFVNRKDNESRRRARTKTREMLQSGVSVLYFPEGTRSSGPMLPFSFGAFKTAVEAKVPVLPVTLSGVRAAMPMRGWPLLGWHEVVLTVHEPLSTEGLSAEKLPTASDASTAAAKKEGEDEDLAASDEASLRKRKAVEESSVKSDVEALAERARTIIGSALRPVDYYAGFTWEEDEKKFMAAWTGPTKESFHAANEAVGADWKKEEAKALRRAGGGGGGGGSDGNDRGDKS